MLLTINEETKSILWWAKNYELEPATLRSRYDRGLRGQDRLNLSQKTNWTKILSTGVGVADGFSPVKKRLNATTRISVGYMFQTQNKLKVGQTCKGGHCITHCPCRSLI